MSLPGDPSLNSAAEAPEADTPTLGVDVSGETNLGETNPLETSDQAIADSAPLLDYPALARFLLEPLIDLPEDLHISSEVTAHNKKVSLRVSLGQADRGRAFGRGGRNIRAIRTIIRAAGKNVGQNVSLEIIGGESDGQVNRGKPKPRKAGEPRPSRPKPKPKSK